jgi:uncharacterized protein DUF3854
MSATTTLPALHPEHLAYLSARGIAPATIATDGSYSASPEDFARLAGRPVPAEVLSALAIPFPGCDGYTVLRLFPPFRDRDGQIVKFLAPAGQLPRLYVPRGVETILGDPSRTLVITEGVTRALALWQIGVLAVAVNGCFGWRSKGLAPDGLLPDLEAVAWSGRPVLWIPDGGVQTNENVLAASYRFARLLEARGAGVCVLRVPQDGDEHAGLDDVLAKAKDPGGTWERLVRKAVGLSTRLFAGLRVAERAKAKAEGKGRAVMPVVADPQPWLEPVDGAQLLEDLAEAARRFVVLPTHADTLVGLWCLAAHAFDAFDTFPFLALVSPVRRCGKTTLFKVLLRLVP